MQTISNWHRFFPMEAQKNFNAKRCQIEIMV